MRRSSLFTAARTCGTALTGDTSLSTVGSWRGTLRTRPSNRTVPPGLVAYATLEDAPTGDRSADSDQTETAPHMQR